MKKSALGLIFLLGVLLLAACREQKKLDVASKINPKKMATMTTKNVATNIFQSESVQYKVVSPLWLIYDEADTPYWTFPKGIYLRQYDKDFKVVTTIAADSAKFFTNEKVWRLDGRVELTKAPKSLFQTQQLFWDQRHGKVYSDSFIHIETETHVLEGYGFISDDQFRAYRVIRPQAIFPIDNKDFMPGAPGVMPQGAAMASPMQMQTSM